MYTDKEQDKYIFFFYLVGENITFADITGVHAVPSGRMDEKGIG